MELKETEVGTLELIHPAQDKKGPFYKHSSGPVQLRQISFYSRNKSKGKGKPVPLEAWSGPEGSRKLRLLDFVTTAQDGGKVVSLTHRPPLSPGNTPGTHLC